MCGITKPVTLRDLHGPAGDLVGQAVFSFDRFSILGPGQWQDSTDGGQAGTQYSTHRGTKKDEATRPPHYSSFYAYNNFTFRILKHRKLR